MGKLRTKVSGQTAKGMLKLKKGDLIIIISVIAVLLISICTAFFLTKDNGEVVQITIDGKLKYEFSLHENKTITVDGYAGGINKIQIENGIVKVTDADCPDKICVHTHSISRTGETIVCMPHRVVVSIKGNKNDVDTVVQ